MIRFGDSGGIIPPKEMMDECLTIIPCFEIYKKYQSPTRKLNAIPSVIGMTAL